MRKHLGKGWTAVRRGRIYCSPLCGGGCTLAAFNRANKEAGALAKRLGPGWKPEVWENLGWHWGAIKGGAKVYPNERRGHKVSGYHVYLETTPQIVIAGCNPVKLVANAIEEARQIAEQNERLIQALE